ncbi:MAG: hypothetical protein JW751_03255 [Polyangiaceae bacterium]|nr:hypothetical protein [Polyangiaceae bacterium]
MTEATRAARQRLLFRRRTRPVAVEQLALPFETAQGVVGAEVPATTAGSPAAEPAAETPVVPAAPDSEGVDGGAQVKRRRDGEGSNLEGKLSGVQPGPSAGPVLGGELKVAVAGPVGFIAGGPRRGDGGRSRLPLTG